MSDNKFQLDRFKEVVREIWTDDEAELNEKLGKLEKQNPGPKENE